MCTNLSPRWILGLVLVGIVGIAALVPVRLSAQSGTTLPGGRTSFEQRFWDYLQEAHYENWAPIPGKRADFYPGESPHGDFLKIYLNRTAAADPAKMPHGSIIVKENYGKDKKLMALTIMYRTKGYDSEHGDWYYVKYEPDGRASRMEGRPVAGKVKMCIDCHSGAKGDDYVFINDD